MRSGPALLTVLVVAACSRPVAVTTTISPVHATLDFGELGPGASSVQKVGLLVLGSGEVHVELDPATVPAGYAVDLGGDEAVRAGQLRTVQVTFAPQAPGVAAGTVVLRARGASNSPVRLDVSGTGVVPRSIAPGDGCLDFRNVQVGMTRTLPMVVQNLRDQPVSVWIRPSNDSFSVTPSGIDLVGLGAAIVQVTYRPATLGSVNGELQFDCPDCQWVKRCMTGTGVNHRFSVSPTVLDFGTVVLRSKACLTAAVRNDGTEPLEIASVEPDVFFTRSQAFSVDPGSLPTPPSSIAPGETANLTVCFSPTVRAAYHAALGLRSASGVVQELGLKGSGIADHIDADPQALEFGIVTGPVTLALLLHNSGDQDDAVINTVTTDAPDDVKLQFPLGDPTGFPVGRTDLPILVTFERGTPSGPIIELLATFDGSTSVRLTVPIIGRLVQGAPCDLSFPPDLRFGLVGAATTGSIELVNRSPTTDCAVWGATTTPTTSSFWVDHIEFGLQVLSPGSAMVLNVTYAPAFPSSTTDTGVLTFHHLGEAGADATESIPLSAFEAAGVAHLLPSRIDFGSVPVGYVKHRALDLANLRDRSATVGRGTSDDISMAPGSSTDFSVTLPDRPTPFEMAPLGHLDLALHYAPQVPGSAQGELQIWLAPFPEPILVPLRGTASGGPCAGSCGQPTALCLDSMTSRTQQTLPVWGAGFAADGGPATCSWQVVDSPQGSSPTLTQGSCETRFVPDLEGNYSLELTVTDAAGQSDSCVTQVTAQDQVGLLIEATPSGADEVDLHLFHPLAGDVLSPSTWFTLPYDCYFSNQNPEWDGPGRNDDPLLDLGDEVGQDAQTVRIDDPSTDHSYEVGVHWYSSDHGNADEFVTTRIICAGRLAAEVQSHLTEVHMAADVGTLTWNGDGTCDFVKGRSTLTVMP